MEGKPTGPPQKISQSGLKRRWQHLVASLGENPRQLSWFKDTDWSILEHFRAKPERVLKI